MSRKRSTEQQASDVRLAGEVQKLLMPKSSPVRSWCCMAARNRMADVLGGDFYDFIKLEDGCQAVLVGDVTGHGLHASVVMSLVYGFIHRAAHERCDARALVSELNNFLRSFAQRSEKMDHFFSATLFFGVIDPGSLRMHYVNAGHPAGIVRRDDQLLRLPATSHPVGYFEHAEFSEEKFQFEDNDRFLLYTDGLVDSNNSAGEMFGVERLDEAFRRLQGDHVLLLDRLFETVETFLSGQLPYDDCTAIVIDFHRSLQNRSK